MEVLHEGWLTKSPPDKKIKWSILKAVSIFFLFGLMSTTPTFDRPLTQYLSLSPILSTALKPQKPFLMMLTSFTCIDLEIS